MGNGTYIPVFNVANMAGYTTVFSTSKGGETAGSVARNGASTSSGSAFQGGETAGSVACGGSSGGFSGGCSYSAIA